MTPMEMIKALAAMETCDEFVKRGRSSEEFVTDAADALETLIGKARDMMTRNKVPTSNFVVGNWSFRRGEMRDGGPDGKLRGIMFSVYPKGERSHWAIRASIYQHGDTWAVHPRAGRLEGAILFDDACKRAVEMAEASTEGR